MAIPRRRWTTCAASGCATGAARSRKAAPEWLDEFDALVERAAEDARAGRDGRNDEVSHVPWPDDQGDAR